MDTHPIAFLLLVLLFPIWPVFAFWLVRIILGRRTAPWVGLVGGLASVALAVGFYLAFAQWLQEPVYARIAALIYGAPATFFFIGFAAAIWLPRHGSRPRGLAAVGREGENESGQPGGDVRAAPGTSLGDERR